MRCQNWLNTWQNCWKAHRERVGEFEFWNLLKSLIDLIEDMPEGVNRKYIKSFGALSESFLSWNLKQVNLVEGDPRWRIDWEEVLSGVSIVECVCETNWLSADSTNREPVECRAKGQTTGWEQSRRTVNWQSVEMKNRRSAECSAKGWVTSKVNSWRNRCCAKKSQPVCIEWHAYWDLIKLSVANLADHPTVSF